MKLNTHTHKQKINKHTRNLNLKQEKIVFSALLVKNMSIAEKQATEEEWTFFFSGIKRTNIHAEDNDNNENKPNWVSHRIWSAIKM